MTEICEREWNGEPKDECVGGSIEVVHNYVREYKRLEV